MTHQTTNNETTLESEPLAKLDSFKVLFKRSVNFLTKHFWSIFSFFFLLSFLPLLFDVLIELVGFKMLPIIQSKAVFFVSSLILTLFALCIAFLFQLIKLGAVKKIQDVSNDIEEPSIVLGKKILKYAIPLFVVWIISIVVTLGGSFLLIVPGIIVAISLTFATTLAVLENKKVGEALLGSFWLVHGRRGQLFLRYLLLALVFLGLMLFVLVFLATITLIVLNIWFGGLDQGIAFFTNTIISGAVQQSTTYFIFALCWSVIVSLVMTPFWALFMVFHFFVYQNLKALVTTDAPEQFNRRTKKILKIFSLVAVGATIVLIVLSIVFGQYRNQEEIFFPQSGETFISR